MRTPYAAYRLAPFIVIATLLAVIVSTRNSRQTPRTDSARVLPAVAGTEQRLDDGATFELVASEVTATIAGQEQRMMAYNGSLPGPMLRVRQGSVITVRFRNELDEPTSVHWHGVRVTNGNDGMVQMPHGGHDQHDERMSAMPMPVGAGETFTYELRFPDPGTYWYHPHVREYKQQDLGLYGAIVVEPADADYWPVADAERVLLLDDVLTRGGALVPHQDAAADYALMGRYGNVMLVDGQEQPEIPVTAGERVRLSLINAANARPFRVTIEGAKLRLIGSDGGRLAASETVEAVILGPSERAVLEAVFPETGEFVMVNRTPAGATTLGSFVVTAPTDTDADAAANGTTEAIGDFSAIRPHLNRAPDTTWEFAVSMSHGMAGMDHGTHLPDGDALPGVPSGIEWEDTMGMMNAHMTDKSTTWKLREQSTGRENMDIVTAWHTGEYRKIRLVNPKDGEHPMQHPFHLHGQRFVVSATDGAANTDLAWKDTVLIPAGSTVDIVVEVTNPGEWMAHCHIAEHLSAGMFTMIRVEGEDLVP